jgi:tetratricopeptide (TPR) repeat protein
MPGKINLGIALLNSNNENNRTRAIRLFNEILKQEPDNPYAHYNLGILLSYREHWEEAIPHFEAVTLIDPKDPQSWFRLGTLLENFSERRIRCLELALELDPYLRGALCPGHRLEPEESRSERKIDPGVQCTGGG